MSCNLQLWRDTHRDGPFIISGPNPFHDLCKGFQRKSRKENINRGGVSYNDNDACNNRGVCVARALGQRM
jgi:hypothetical protein